MIRVVEVQTQHGAWQYVKDSPEGLRFGIYSTNALPASELERCQKTHPELTFRLSPVLRKVP
jgi:hypothetical protein